MPADPKHIEEIQKLLKRLVRAIVKRDHAVLGELFPDLAKTQESFFYFIDLYPNKLRLPPKIAYSAISYDGDYNLPDGWKAPMIYIFPRDDGSWGVDCFLWTKEEGLCGLMCSIDIEWKEGKPEIVYTAGVYCP